MVRTICEEQDKGVEMGIVKSIKMSRREFYKTKPFELDKERALAFVCDEIIILPTKKNKEYSIFKNIDVVICSEGKPLCRLLGGGDIISIKPSKFDCNIDYLTKSNLVRLIPDREQRFRVDWDGTILHVSVLE